MVHHSSPHDSAFAPLVSRPCEFLMAIGQPEQLLTWLGENTHCLGICTVGRSNVGKSSLINTLFGQATARTSKTPGRTREVLIFRFYLDDFPETPLYLFDIPGYGHAEVSKEMKKNWDLLLFSFFQYLSPFVRLITIQDARHPDQKADQDFSQFIRSFHLETVLVFNKIDKLKSQKEKAGLQKQKVLLFKKYKWVKEVYFISAEKKTGIEELKAGIRIYLQKTIARFNEQGRNQS